MKRARLAVAMIASVVLVASCDENLPSGPNTFSVTTQIVSTGDTLVIGQTRQVQARVTDAQGNVINGLHYAWKSADSNLVAVRQLTAATDSLGQTMELTAKRPGLSVLTLSLPDPRFVTTAATRTVTAVVGGVRVLSSHDSTLTSVNDTARAIATSLVRTSATDPTLINRASQGVRWVHLGDKTTIVGTGDTIRYIARANGVDTLIATHDFCLAGAQCADTVIARVSQQLTFSLSAKTFQQWSFSDTVGPTIVLADRRGNGLAGTSVRFVPRTAADSAIVKIGPTVGTSNPTTGAVAAPRVITAGNGTARVSVLGIAPDGFSVIATDSLLVIVRQVARRVAAEPLRAIETRLDSIPVRLVARDARGAAIPDATIGVIPSGLTLNGLYAVPITGAASPGTLTPSLSGVALPSNNPGAPQIPVTVDAGIITFEAADTVVAGGATQRLTSTIVLDSLGQVPAGKWVRYYISNIAGLDSSQIAADGTVTIIWTPPNIAASYALTGIMSSPIGFNTVADSAGRIVIRHTLVIKNDVAIATQSSLAVGSTTVAQGGQTTIVVTVKDQFGNPVLNVTPADITLAASGVGGGGTIGALTCSNTTGICTATYTAPGAAGATSISAKIGGADILNSPIAITVP
jgi:hypothetical protein